MTMQWGTRAPGRGVAHLYDPPAEGAAASQINGVDPDGWPRPALCSFRPAGAVYADTGQPRCPRCTEQIAGGQVVIG